jgi:2-aminoadipate transaminase
MFAERMANLKSSAIRDILKLTTRPGMISFAGGLPAPELFPLNDIEEAMHRALAKYGSNALQYSVTEGIVPLREKIAAMLDPSGQSVKPQNIIITQGSQQGLELLSKLFLDKGSLVLTENPSYLGALQAFRLFQSRFNAIPSDENGIRPGALREALEKLNWRGNSGCSSLKTTPTASSCSRETDFLPCFRSAAGTTWST